MSRSMSIAAVVLLSTGVAYPDGNLVFNGEFTENDDGWTLPDHPEACCWQGLPGCNGEPGFFFVNHNGDNLEVETNQLVEGLEAGETYIVSGCYNRHDAYAGKDPQFRALVDDTVGFETAGDEDWQPFEFEFVADDGDVLLRFVTQLTADIAFEIDNIRLEATNKIPTVSEWGLIVLTVVALGVGVVVLRRTQRHAA